MRKGNKKIVVIGGGTGVFTVLTGLKQFYDDLTAIVTMADDGGSTGILREEFGILPPGDVRRALVALSSTDNALLAKLFSYRFNEGKTLNGHSFGNLMIAALERITGDFYRAIDEAGKILSVRGKVLPVTMNKTTLNAELCDGQVIKGESKIDIPSGSRARIKRAWLAPQPALDARAKKAILDADAIIIGPGDLYTSIIPNLLVSGLKGTLKKTKARIIYVVNLMTKCGETDGFKASDFLRIIEEYLGKGILDFVVVNSQKPSCRRITAYKKEGSGLVVNDLKISFGKPEIVSGDLSRAQGFLRHDSRKLACVIRSILEKM